MNFEELDIYPILKASIPNRFSDMDPYDFEKFIGHLFKKKGYIVLETKGSNDFGADLIVTKDKKYVIQVKRYGKDNKVGVPDVNQILGAKEYYDSDKTMIVSTSSYTKSAKKLCEKTGVKYWGWQTLLKKINEVYFEGKDFYKYFEKDLFKKKEGKINLNFELKRVLYKQNMTRGSDTYTLVFFILTNNSNKNLYLKLQSPIYISKSNYQYKMDYWYENYFRQGRVYAGVKVEVAFMFKSSKISRISKGDRFILEVQNEKYEKLYTEDYIVKKNSNCYVVTMCYGRGTKEYKEMIKFRDIFLNKFLLGKKFIILYYKYGKIFANKYKNNKIFIKINIKTYNKISSVN